MKRTIAAVTLALALGLPAMNATAQTVRKPQPRPNGPAQQPPGDRPGQGQRPPPPPLLAALDKDTNGVLSAEEIVNAPDALRTLDKNGDGQLTADELRPARPAFGGPNGPQGQPGRPGQPPQDGQDRPARPEGVAPDGAQRPPPPPLMGALDTTRDGVIDATEIANAAAALLTLDKNGDGQLTRDELQPPRPGPGDQQPGDGQRPPRGRGPVAPPEQ